MAEFDVIDHLVDVEHQASTLLADAQKEGDKIISEARLQADLLYKEKFAQLIKNFEEEQKNNNELVKEQKRKVFEDFKKKINLSPTDTKEFNKLLDKLFLKKTV